MILLYIFPNRQSNTSTNISILQKFDNDLSLVIIVSNGCNLNNECGVVREFLSDLIENVYVFEDYVDLEIIQNALRALEVYYHRYPNEM